jgi:hypothetical protein
VDLAFALIFTWDLAGETIPVLEFAVERYPSSVPARAMLAEALRRRD